jgi:hypothetical protein
MANGSKFLTIVEVSTNTTQYPPNLKSALIKYMRTNTNLLALLLAATVFTTGCDMKHEKSSDDIGALRQLVEIDVPASSVRWEVFGTPEYTGGVPGPTYIITLIAEVQPSNEETFKARPKTGTVWIAPEAARPWLPERFRAILAKHHNNSADLSSMYNCRKFQGKRKANQKPFEGFICDDAGRSLIYLTLWSETGL